MPKRTPVAIACILLLGCFGAALAQDAPKPPSAAASSPPPTTSGDPQTMETVSITASKRKERLQDAPAAITSLSAEKLENLGVESFAGYASLVPNLAQFNGGAPGFGTVVIRGLYSGSQQTTNTTAFYLGESPFSYNGAFSIASFITPDVDLFDVASIEVLKGPQGTLYGATALGGLIRIVPKLPDTNSFSGNVRVGAGSTSGGSNGYQGKILLNVPIQKDTLALQIGAIDRQEGGYTKNTRTGHGDLGEAKFTGGGATLLYTPAKDLQFTLRALSQQAKSNGPTYQDNLLATGTPTTGAREFSSLIDAQSKAKYDLVEGTAQYDTSWGTATAAVSHAQTNLKLQFDYTAYAALFAGAYCKTFPAACTPAPDYNGLSNPNVKLSKNTTEVRFASKRIGSFEYLLGAFYTHETSNYFIDILGVNSALQPVAAPFNNIITSDTSGGYSEYSGFGDLTYYFTNDIDLTGGLRRAHNSQHYFLMSTGLLGRASQHIESSDNSTTYQVTARWRPTRELSTFARIATGYRPGGPQNNPAAPNPTFDPDKVTNYELGVKGQAMSGRLGYDASAYHIDWKNIQLNALLGGILIVGNAGKATINGFEAQSTYYDPSGISVGASFGYNDAKLKDVGGTTAAYIGAAPGDRLPGSPRLTAALYADYRFVPMGDVQGSVGATVRYQGDKHSGFSQPGVVNPDFLEPSYTTLDLRTSAQWQRYSLRLGLENVTNRNGYASYTTIRVRPTQTVSSQAIIIRPRTVTLTLAADF